ncbi:MAG: RHS repeat protein, partial [Flavobacteriales bacterium]|nr:RHS repeat protein [Flavobacteriales bacterium]
DKDQLVYTDAGGLLADRKKEIAYQYDKNGNLTYKHDSKGAKYFFWDAHGRLKKASFGNRTYTHYEYDALGRRISKKNLENKPRFIIFTMEILQYSRTPKKQKKVGE